MLNPLSTEVSVCVCFQPSPLPSYGKSDANFLCMEIKFQFLMSFLVEDFNTSKSCQIFDLLVKILREFLIFLIFGSQITKSSFAVFLQK